MKNKTMKTIELVNLHTENVIMQDTYTLAKMDDNRVFFNVRTYSRYADSGSRFNESATVSLSREEAIAMAVELIEYAGKCND